MRARRIRLLARVFGSTIVLAGATPGAAETIRTGTVLDRVTVIDVRTGRLQPGRAIVLRDGRIAGIVAAGSVVTAGTATRIDGGGRFVVPGFNDMHAHNLNSESPETSLPLMLANGITGFRQMAGSPALLKARAADKLPMPAAAPALLAMPGTILAGPAFADPAAAAAEVRRQKADGADFIKEIGRAHV